MPTLFKRKIRRSGDGYEINLPAPIIETLGFNAGEDVIIYQTDEGLICIRRLTAEEEKKLSRGRD